MREAHSPPIKAVAFDAYGTLFDVYSVGETAERLFPGKGQALAQLWREKQIDYTRIRTMSDRYVPFSQVTQEALAHACARLGLPLTEAQQRTLMAAYDALTAFADVTPTLAALKASGLKLAILSNGNPEMLEAAVSSAGLSGAVDHVISAHAVRQFKTAAAVYALGPATLGCTAREILFVSSNGWDAAGATWFGYTTFWVNRAGHPAEALGVQAHGEGRSLKDVLTFVSAQSTD